MIYIVDSFDDEEGNGQNYGTVAMAAGLCVIVPLLMVAFIQCIKQHKDKQRLRRRLQNRQSCREISRDAPTQTNRNDTDMLPYFYGPPAYDSLFGLGSTNVSSGSTETLIEQEPRQRSGDVTSVNLDSGVDNPVFQISGSNIYNHTLTIGAHTEDQSRRFPGMHISIFDFGETDADTLPTPPPSYGDALVSIGELPPKYSDVEVV